MCPACCSWPCLLLGFGGADAGVFGRPSISKPRWKPWTEGQTMASDDCVESVLLLLPSSLWPSAPALPSASDTDHCWLRVLPEWLCAPTLLLHYRVV